MTISYKDYETIPVGEEKKYYQEDSYYTTDGVVTFEERIKTTFPSKRGLYPEEILLLAYCAKGHFPHPKYRYQGFWWFQYGIRNVGAALKSLEDRRFITYASVKDSLKSFTVQQLKDLLSARGYSMAGKKKADLVECVAIAVPKTDLYAAGLQLKYILTELGEQELKDNEYVPYMHRSGGIVDVWTINRMLTFNVGFDWKSYVEQKNQQYQKESQERWDAFIAGLDEDDPFAQTLISQEQQIKAVQAARKKYDDDHDLDSYIEFWENIWNNGGLIFEGVTWHYELANLYIKANRYDDAYAFVNRIKNTKGEAYSNRADSLIKEIERRIAKHK